MSEEQIKDMILKQCLELTTNNDFRPPISAYDGVDIDDVVRTCKQLQDKKTYLDLVKENQELKSQLKGTTHCFDVEEHKKLKKQLEVGEEQYNDLVEEKEILQEQLSIKTLQLEELKKQLENNSKINVADHKYASECEDKVIVLETQQKEFINYLEYQVKLQEELNDIHLATGFEEILQKYKSIIGVSDDKK